MPSRKQLPDDGTPKPPARKKASPAAAAEGAPAKKPRTRALPDGEGNSRKPDLVIVESPAKAKTINKYLGPNFKVLASYGHVRDLPKRRKKGEIVAGIDIEGGWMPTYVVGDKDDDKGGKASRRRTPKDILAELKREAAKSNRVFLATDPDREGEAIAWHIEDALDLDEERTFRITFNEITRTAVQNALASPGKIDMDRVHAQEARRILDRVVGYPLSNLLSKKVARALSAGRVQSVAVRLVVDREREIEAFKPRNSGRSRALLAPQGAADLIDADAVGLRALTSRARVRMRRKKATTRPRRKRRRRFPKARSSPSWPSGPARSSRPRPRRQSTASLAALDTAALSRLTIEQKDRQEKAPPPFTTRTLQQQANIRLHFTGDRTMRWPRSCTKASTSAAKARSRSSPTCVPTARASPTRRCMQCVAIFRAPLRPQYLPAKPNFFAVGKSAQEAHEAIRPTDVSYTPERVTRLGLQRRSAARLHADLSALRRQPDDAGHLRRHQRRGAGHAH